MLDPDTTVLAQFDFNFITRPVTEYLGQVVTGDADHALAAELINLHSSLFLNFQIVSFPGRCYKRAH